MVFITRFASRMPGHRVNPINMYLLEEDDNQANKPKKRANKSRLVILVGLFLLTALCVWATMKPKQAVGPEVSHKLVIASVFSRHGDRAPVLDNGKLDAVYGQAVFDYFWPDGIKKLTELGKFRMFRLGLELRRIYDDFLNYDKNEVLALSSSAIRCTESLKQTLRGLYNMETTVAKGLGKLRQVERLGKGAFPTGSGSGATYKEIPVDTSTLHQLNDRKVNSCPSVRNYAIPFGNNLMDNPKVRELPGVDLLRQMLHERFNYDFGFDVTHLFGDIEPFFSLILTQESFNITDKYIDWINIVVHQRNGLQITLYDVWAQCTLLGRLHSNSPFGLHMQLGPVFGSLVDSQLVALGQKRPIGPLASYANKKLVLYSSHDSLLHKMLVNLGIAKWNSPFVDRYYDFMSNPQVDEFQLYINGLSVTSYGGTFRFEVWQAHTSPARVHQATSGQPLPTYVKAFIYNDHEIKMDPIEFKQVKLGQVCMDQLKLLEPNEVNVIDKYYQKGELLNYIDPNMDCPFDLWLKVTERLTLGQDTFEELCHKIQ